MRRRIAFDVALVVALAVIAFLEAALHADNGYRGTAAPLLGGALAAIGPLPLLARRERPVLATAATTALTCLPHLAVSYDPVFIGGLGAVVIAVESAARYGRRRRNRVALLLPLPGIAVLALAIPGFAGDTPAAVVLVLAGWTLGVVVRALLERRGALSRALTARRDEEAAILERTIVDERIRVARDLHDVIAHSVSVMVLQAGAARLQLPIDPARSAEAVARIEEVGREALVELKRVLGVLAPDGDDDDTSLAALDGLVDDLRRAGLVVRFEVRGDPAALPAALERSLYRVVQESLTNALKHASDPEVDLRLAVSGARVELEVENPARPGRATTLPGGNGQVGMRERIAAFGGAFSAGLDGGLYRVHASVPLTEDA